MTARIAPAVALASLALLASTLVIAVSFAVYRRSVRRGEATTVTRSALPL